ncbi:MAG: hypothetical protein LIP16_16340 [Clostridium sp.]|nr:hypothetical protein [Clostridium sp.]
MKQLIENIAQSIPRELKNTRLIKRQNILVPYCEIGITCLTKDTAQINIFYETILKYIDMGVNEISEIATVMGVKFKLLKEVIADMIDQQYVTTSEGRLKMTPKGKKALDSRKIVTIRKRNINQIIVNMISGEMEGNDNLQYIEAHREVLCLNEELTITKDFLDKHYASINEIYQKNQIEYNIFNTNYLSRELYKILDIAYSKLIYVKEELMTFKNDETNSYEFRITGDIGERYLNCFYNQVRDIVFPGLENFFERDWKFSQQDQNRRITNSVNEERTISLIQELYSSENITNEIMDKFTQERALIEGTEIDKYFLYYRELDFKGVIISCRRLRRIMSREIISGINQIQNKRIIVFFDEDEYEIEDFLNKQFVEMIRQGKIVLIKRDGTIENFICFYPNIYIRFEEIIESVFERPFTVINGKIEFEESVIKGKMDKFIEDNGLCLELPQKENKADTQSRQKQYRNKGSRGRK